VPEIIKRRRLKEKDDLHKLLGSMRQYYEAYTDKYVEFYNSWSKQKNAFSDPNYKEGYDRVAETLITMVKPEEEVIDIGCGVGTWSTLLAENGASVISLDYSSSILIRCGRKAKNLGLKSEIYRILADGFYLPFQDRTFDGATLNWILAHIPVNRNYTFLREVARVLRENGWLVISDSYWRGQEGGKEQVQVRDTDKGTYEIYKYYYAPEELRNLMKNHFGKVEQLQTTHYEMICVARKYWTSK